MRRFVGLAALVLAVVALDGRPAAATSRAPKQPAKPLPGIVTDRVRFEPLEPHTTHLTVADLGDYRGAVTIGPAGDDSHHLAIVNELPFEDYLLGVSEMPASWPFEAQRAQAIAARTYALYQLTAQTPTPAHAMGADICASPDCQAYTGLTKERSDGAVAWQAAVQSTKGQVVLYKGQAINAKYTSSNGGRTVAGGQPYLKATDDPDDVNSPQHRWHVNLPIDQVDQVLGLPAAPAGVTRQGDQISFVAADGSTLGPSLNLLDFRDRLNAGVSTPDGVPVPVPSVQFNAAVDINANALVLDGEGFGHGIGLSQWGALGKAARGMKADAILAAYYGGLKPVQLGEGQEPANINVVLDFNTSSTGISTGGPSQTFRVFDGSGRALATVANGEWKVLTGPTPGTVRVVPPADQAGTLQMSSAFTSKAARGHPVSLELSLSVPAIISATATPPGGAPVPLPALDARAGNTSLRLPAPSISGVYSVVIQADAGNGRVASTTVDFLVKAQPIRAIQAGRHNATTPTVPAIVLLIGVLAATGRRLGNRG